MDDCNGTLRARGDGDVECVTCNSLYSPDWKFCGYRRAERACPFCGSDEAKVSTLDISTDEKRRLKTCLAQELELSHAVRCPCGALGPIAESEAAAVKAWNAGE